MLSAAIGTLGIAALQAPLAAFIALIPKIIVAVVLVVIGGVVAGAVKKLIQASLGGLSYGTILADAVGVLVILGFVKAALDEVGIATQVTGPVLYALLATVGGILVVGVGGALIRPMQPRLERALSRAETEAESARRDARTYPSDTAASTSSSTGGSVATSAPTQAYSTGTDR